MSMIALKNLTPTCRSKIFLELASDSAFTTLLGRSAQVGDKYYNTTTNVLREYATGGWRNATLQTIDIITSDITENISSDNLSSTIDKYKGRVFLGGNLIINAAAGTYTPFTLEDITTSEKSIVKILGDTREIAAVGYIHSSGHTGGNQYGQTFYNNSPLGGTNLGNGYATFTPSGNSITVACNTTNPDFDAAGVVNGDTVIKFISSTRTYSRITVDYVDATNKNKIWFTTDQTGIGADGDTLVFAPNRIINHATNTVIFRNSGRVIFEGFKCGCPVDIGRYSVGASDRDNVLLVGEGVPNPIVEVNRYLGDYVTSYADGPFGDLNVYRGTLVGKHLAFTAASFNVQYPQSVAYISNMFWVEKATTAFFKVYNGSKAYINYLAGNFFTTSCIDVSESEIWGNYWNLWFNRSTTYCIFLSGSLGHFVGLRIFGYGTGTSYGMRCRASTLSAIAPYVDGATFGYYVQLNTRMNLSGPTYNSVSTAYSPVSSGTMGNFSSYLNRS